MKVFCKKNLLEYKKSKSNFLKNYSSKSKIKNTFEFSLEKIATDDIHNLPIIELAMWRDVARCGAMWRDVARCGAYVCM